MTTATSVARCSMMVKNIAPSVTPNIFCNKSRCPLLLTGRNSVKPCTNPSSIAIQIVITTS